MSLSGSLRTEAGHKWFNAAIAVTLLLTLALLSLRSHGGVMSVILMSIGGLLVCCAIYWERIRRTSPVTLLLIGFAIAILIWIPTVVMFLPRLVFRG